MTLDDFLAALAQALDEAQTCPRFQAVEPAASIPQVLYDPAFRETAPPDWVLVGLGHWQHGDRPVEHQGICLNIKDIAERFGEEYRYLSVTDLVLAPPEPLRGHWEQRTAGCRGPAEILNRFTLIVEDCGPDSCFALLCWVARCSGVDPAELASGRGRPWVQAVRQWEGTGMAGDPVRSWAALLASLGHSYLPSTPTAARDNGTGGPLDFSLGWREALRLTVALLRDDVAPDAVPELWHLDTYVRAHAFLEVERQEYLGSLGQAICLQLWVPLNGSGERARRLLVDAYFAVETWPSGTRKLFARNDREHSHLHQGFTLMGLYRPGDRGTGGDITIAVNPWTGIDLRLLWVELERLENGLWEGRRPRDRIRSVAGYPAGEGFNEPWWDDSGRYTLLGAPKALPDCPNGSRLTWPEVLEATWRSYSPVGDLRVRDLLAERDCLLSECRREAIRTAGGGLTRQLAAMRWLADTTHPQSLFSTPTTRRALGSLVSRDHAGEPLTLAGLPPEQDLESVPLSGGFAVLHRDGVVLFDDWRPEPLRVDELRREVHSCVALLNTLREIDIHLAGLRTAGPLAEAARKPWHAIGILTDLATQRRHLADAQDRHAAASLDADVRRFRSRLSKRWSIDEVAADLHHRLTQMEETIRTASILRTQGLVKILSVYALPFVISKSVADAFEKWIESRTPETLTIGLQTIAAYLILSGLMIGVVVVIQSRWMRTKTYPLAPPEPGDPTDAHAPSASE